MTFLHLAPFALISTAFTLYGGIKLGMLFERARLAKALEEMQARLTLQKSAAEFQRASNATLTVLRGGK